MLVWWLMQPDNYAMSNHKIERALWEINNNTSGACRTTHVIPLLNISYACNVSLCTYRLYTPTRSQSSTGK